MAQHEETKEPKASKTARKIKYLGDSDVRIIEKGENWADRLGAPLEEALRWDWSNHHLVVVDLPQETLDLLLEDPEFKDVTDQKTIPRAAVEKRRRPVESDASAAAFDARMNLIRSNTTEVPGGTA